MNVTQSRLVDFEFAHRILTITKLLKNVKFRQSDQPIMSHQSLATIVTLSPYKSPDELISHSESSHYRSRKRRTSYTQDERDYLFDGDEMDECNAALVLMSLSCSPNSPRQGESSSSSYL